MKKLEKDLYIKHAKRLSVIIDEKSTFVTFLKRADFKNVIQSELNVLAACEKLFSKVDLEPKLTSKAMVKKYNTLTKESIKIDEKFKYEDETDLIDSINYLVTFCNNLFKVNLDDLLEGKQVTATDPKIDLRAKPQFDEDGPRMNSNFAFAGAGIPLAGTPYENPYFVGKAYAKLQDDMEAGKFYRFKTKPRIIPIAKWCSIIITLLILVSFTVASVFAFMCNIIFDGVFDLIVVAFGAYSLSMVMKTVVGRRKKNDNMKYFFNWQFIMIALILFGIFSLTNSLIYWLNTTLPDNPEPILVAGFGGLRITSIIACGLTALDIVPLVIGAVKNPKPDVERVETKIKEYIDMFAADSGQMPVPPKADIQKPTTVEDPKKKPDKDKTKK